MGVIELELDNGSMVEVDVSTSGDALDYSGSGDRIRKCVEDLVEGSFASMLSLIIGMHERAVSSLPAAAEIEIAFALGVNARGDLKIVSGEASASITMKTVWQNG